MRSMEKENFELEKRTTELTRIQSDVERRFTLG